MIEIKEKILFLGMFVLVVVSLISFVIAERLISDAGVKYDFGIYEEFNKTNEYDPLVLVRLKDDSGISIVGTKEEKIELMKQRDELLRPKVEEVLSTLSEDEFELSRIHSREFSGWITQKGFEKLINDSRIESVSWVNQGGSAMDSENESNLKKVEGQNQTENEKEVGEEKQKSKGLLIFVGIVIILIVILGIMIKRRKI